MVSHVIQMLATVPVETANDQPLSGTAKDIVIGLIGVLTTAIVVALRRYFDKSDKKVEEKSTIYKADVDQLVKQREFIIKENEELWTALRIELDTCRAEREKLDAVLENHKKRIAKIENDLYAWEIGLRTPVGFKLTRLDTAEIEKLNQSKGDEKNNG